MGSTVHLVSGCSSLISRQGVLLKLKDGKIYRRNTEIFCLDFKTQLALSNSYFKPMRLKKVFRVCIIHITYLYLIYMFYPECFSSVIVLFINANKLCHCYDVIFD